MQEETHGHSRQGLCTFVVRAVDWCPLAQEEHDQERSSAPARQLRGVPRALPLRLQAPPTAARASREGLPGETWASSTALAAPGCLDGAFAPPCWRSLAFFGQQRGRRSM